MSIILPTTYFSFKKAKLVKQICEPLFNRYNLNMIVYSRIFYDGTSYHLTNHLDYQEYYFEKGFMTNPPIPRHLISNRFFYVLTPEQYELYGDTFKLYNFNYPIYFFEMYPDYCDMYLFCFKNCESKFLNLFLNDIKIIEKFKFYLKDKLAKRIAELERNKIILSGNTLMSLNELKNVSSSSPQTFDKQKPSLNMLIKHYTLIYKNKEILLTKREVDALKYLAHGYTIKEIAKSMCISPRTVEDYLKNVQFKFNVDKKSKIIDVALEAGLNI